MGSKQRKWDWAGGLSFDNSTTDDGRDLQTENDFQFCFIIFDVNLMFQAERGWNWCQWRGNQITI